MQAPTIYKTIEERTATMQAALAAVNAAAMREPGFSKSQTLLYAAAMKIIKAMSVAQTTDSD